MIQAYASKKRLISSIMPKERCYSLYQEEKSIGDKILEAVKATILGNSKTPHKPYTYVNFHYVTRGDLIKAGPHQFYFGKNSNGPSKYDISDKNHHTDADGDTSMILTNLSKRDKISPPDIRKLFSITKPSSTHEMKELTIYGKLHRQINTSLSVCLPTTTHIFNHWLTVVLMVDLLVSILLLSIRPPTGMSTSEASIIMRLLHFPLLPFSLWNIQMLDQSSSLCTGMYIMERVRPSIPL